VIDTFLVYVLKLVDRELYYVGSCRDPLKRLGEHAQGTGAFLAKLYPPVGSRAVAVAHSRREARRLERRAAAELQREYPGVVITLGELTTLVRYQKLKRRKRTRRRALARTNPTTRQEVDASAPLATLEV